MTNSSSRISFILINKKIMYLCCPELLVIYTKWAVACVTYMLLKTCSCYLHIETCRGRLVNRVVPRVNRHKNHHSVRCYWISFDLVGQRGACLGKVKMWGRQWCDLTDVLLLLSLNGHAAISLNMVLQSLLLCLQDWALRAENDRTYLQGKCHSG